MQTPARQSRQAPSAVESVLGGHGVHTRPLRRAIELLLGGWQRFDELIRATTAPRRSVEALLDALTADLETDRQGRMRIRPEVAGDYAHWRTPAQADPLDDAVAAHAGLLTTLAGQIAGVPAPIAALDHVQATPETVLRRALWLNAQYDLSTARLVLLGDHDLTSLAVHAVCPGARITVVDLDERVLAYLDQLSGRAIRTLHADLRVGLPVALGGGADLVFSDPPYTPEGMGLFATRGVQALETPHRGRLVLAYGYSPLHPALGADVQRTLAGLGLTFEAILPGFNRYTGAQAVGSAADLYVCQPAARSGKNRGGRTKVNIYTHGPQSVEAVGTNQALREELSGHAGAHGHPVDSRLADWTKPIGTASAIAVDLTADPGPWLLRFLLAANAPRIAALVPNSHPDLGDQRSQESLRAAIAGKYTLRFLRSTPDNKHAVVLAQVGDAPTAAGSLLHRAHGKLANVLREALIQASAGTLTKNQARALIEEHAADIAEHRLIDLPRHRIAELLGLLGRVAAGVQEHEVPGRTTPIG